MIMIYLIHKKIEKKRTTTKVIRQLEEYRKKSAIKKNQSRVKYKLKPNEKNKLQLKSQCAF